FFKDWELKVNEDDKYMSISSPNGQNIELLDKSGEESITMTFDSSNAISISSEGVEITGKSITLKSDQGDVSIEAVNAEIKAKSKASLTGAQVQAESNATTTIKGQTTLVN
ncbi:MAG: hypothetical protein MK066_13680, partial [Crocinitomicaceae bacterium]|nr:hypothetical protein [Crocinitomicaceae bacterium]